MSFSGKQVKEKRSTVLTPGAGAPLIRPRPTKTSRVRLANSLQQQGSDYKSPSTACKSESIKKQKNVASVESFAKVGYMEPQNFIDLGKDFNNEQNARVEGQDVLITPRGSVAAEVVVGFQMYEQYPSSNPSPRDEYREIVQNDPETTYEHKTMPSVLNKNAFAIPVNLDHLTERDLSPSRSADLLTTFASESFCKAMNDEAINEGIEECTSFHAKLAEFEKMKKELDIRQRTFLEVFESVKNLHKHLPEKEREKHSPILFDADIKIVEVGDWAKSELADLCHGIGPDNCIFGDDNKASKIKNAMELIHNVYAEFCVEVLTKREEVIHVCGNNDVHHNLEKWNLESQLLNDSCTNVNEKTKDILDSTIGIAEEIWTERCSLLDRAQQLTRTVETLKNMLTELQSLQAAPSISGPCQITQSVALIDNDASKESETATVNQLNKELSYARSKIAKLEKQLNEMSSSLANSASTIKFLEEKNKKWDSSVDQNDKKLRETVRTNNILISKLREKCADFEERVKSLTEDRDRNIEEHKKKMADVRLQMQDLRAKVTEQQKKLQSEIAEREKLNKPGPTQEELDIKADLEAAKVYMSQYIETIEEMKQERERLLQALTCYQDTNNELVPQRVLSNEIHLKDSVIEDLQSQIRAFVRDCKFYQGKSELLENFIAGNHNKLASSSKHDLKSLELRLLEAKHCNEQLTSTLHEQERALERERRSNKVQAENFKVREELIASLKRHETEQAKEIAALKTDLNSRICIVEAVKTQMSDKAEELQKVFSTLEEKAHLVDQLEKTLNMRDDQLSRLQEERLRHEGKIGELETQLQTANEAINHKRFFLF